MATKEDKRGLVISTVEMHTGGEPLRIIQSGRGYRIAATENHTVW